MSSKRRQRRVDARRTAEHRQNSCSRKVVYSAEEAKRIQAGLWTRNRMVAYRCEFGDHWHVGHSNVVPRRGRS